MSLRPCGPGLTLAASLSASACRLADGQPHVDRLGVETIVSRANMSLYQLIPSYNQRHDLQN